MNQRLARIQTVITGSLRKCLSSCPWPVEGKFRAAVAPAVSSESSVYFVRSPNCAMIHVFHMCLSRPLVAPHWMIFFQTQSRPISSGIFPARRRHVLRCRDDLLLQLFIYTRIISLFVIRSVSSTATIPCPPHPPPPQVLI